jgi:GH25 family lysozyme M1 (1,4-beta-N-acetylmuramidase)
VGHAASIYRGYQQTAHHGGIIMSEERIDYDAWAISSTDKIEYAAHRSPTWPNIAYIPGVDVSKWQGKMDWAKCKAAGAKYAFVRATVGAGYVDTQYIRNVEEIDHVELPFGVYHVIVPRYAGKIVTADMNMSNFLENIGDTPPDFPVILDCELTNGDNPRHITSVIEGCIKILNDNLYRVMIYTGAWWWDGNVMPADKWRDYPLHVANYTSAAQPYMPRDWDEWDVWQWSADGNGKGHEYGADSHDIDLNRMKVAFWNKHIGVIEEPEPVEPPVPSKVATMQGRLIVGNDIYEGEGIYELIDE